MPDDPSKRFAGGPEAKLFAIGHKDFKGINTQVPRDSIGDDEFSWLENMQPIGKSLYSLPDAINNIPNVGTGINPVVYFYMYGSDQSGSNMSPPSEYVFIAFAAGNGQINSATSGGLIASFTATGSFNPGNVLQGTPLCQATQFNSSGIAIVANTSNSSGLYAADSTSVYKPGGSAPTWFASNATGATMATGISGDCITVWQARLWIAKGNIYFSSAPADGTDWTINNGATLQESQDPFIRLQFLSLAQANGFLYIFGDSSVNVISNIQSSGSPVITTFNNQNVDPQIGVTWQNTVQAYGRGLIYANSTGVYALFGGAAQKVSDQLDGIFDAGGNFIASLSLSAGPSSAVTMINNQRCYLLLVPLQGPFDSVNRNALVVWDGKKWFIASQSVNLTFIGTQMIASTPIAWGTDGINIYKLFASPGGRNINKIWQTKLFNGTGLQITKSAYRMFARYIDVAGSGINETATIDSQLINSLAVQQTFSQVGNPSLIVWQNASLQTVQFRNSTPANVNWTSGSMIPEIAGTGLSVSDRGNVIGWTATSSSNLFILTEEMMIYQEQSPIGG